MNLNDTQLLTRIVADFPEYSFSASDQFAWLSSISAIHFNPGDLHFSHLLLHEVAHAQLKHSSYETDAELLTQEVEAWEHSRNLAQQYSCAPTPEDLINDSLGSYRTWLWKRSLCPMCTQTGLQHQKNAYSCINCRHSWRVNDARRCNQRRTTHRFD